MKKIIGRHLIYIAVIVAYCFLIGCPFYKITGINCPFCGMTRAHLSFFKGDFAGAFNFHPLFFLGIPTVLGLAHLRVLKKHKAAFITDAAFLVSAAAALICRYAQYLISAYVF